MVAPRSGREKNPSLQPDSQVLLEADAEAVLPLGLAQAGEEAHLGLVLSAAADLRRGIGGELAIARIAVAQRGEPGTEPRRQLRALGGRLAVIAAGGAGARGHVAEAHAPLLAAAGRDGVQEQAVLRQDEPGGADRAAQRAAGDGERP